MVNGLVVACNIVAVELPCWKPVGPYSMFQVVAVPFSVQASVTVLSVTAATVRFVGFAQDVALLTITLSICRSLSPFDRVDSP